MLNDKYSNLERYKIKVTTYGKNSRYVGSGQETPLESKAGDRSITNRNTGLEII